MDALYSQVSSFAHIATCDDDVRCIVLAPWPEVGRREASNCAFSPLYSFLRPIPPTGVRGWLPAPPQLRRFVSPVVLVTGVVPHTVTGLEVEIINLVLLCATGTATKQSQKAVRLVQTEWVPGVTPSHARPIRQSKTIITKPPQPVVYFRA